MANISWPPGFYIEAAKALSKRFPALKKYRRRSPAKLKPYEKAHIRRLYNIYEIVSTTPNDDRPDYLKFFVFPGERLPGYKRRVRKDDPDRPGYHGRGDESVIRAGLKLAEFFPEFKKLRRRRTLTPKLRRRIEHLEKRMRYANNLFPFSKNQLDILKRQRRTRLLFPVKGVESIKLKNIEASPLTDDPAILREYGPLEIVLTPYGMFTRQFVYRTNNVRMFKFVYVSRRGDSQTPAILAAGEKLLNEGAKALYIWMNHGRTAVPFRSVAELAATMGDEGALEQVAEESGAARANIVDSPGFQKAFQLAEEARNLGLVKAAVPWVVGVIGLFERKTKSPMLAIERFAIQYGRETGQIPKRRRKR